jgi:hydroxycarboxylate dehydrogenase B
MPRIPSDDLMEFAVALLVAGGAEKAEAATVARSLVEANLREHDSHGVMRLPSYLDKLERNEVVPGASLEIIKETPSLVTADGQWGFGQVQAGRLTKRLIGKTQASGMAIGTLRRVTHVGRLGEYCELAAAAGLIGQIMANSHGNQRWVAPPGGAEARLGTNPIAYGIPNGAEPIIFDFSTAATAEGKVRLKRIAGRKCPDDWLLDPEGRPTTDPAALYRDPPGTIRSLGGDQAFKGFGLGLMAEIFAGALSGGECARERPNNPKGNCLFVQLIDPAVFFGAEEFAVEVARLIEYIRECPRRDGVGEIVLPGDRSRRSRDERIRDGIPIDDDCWRDLSRLGMRLDVPMPGRRLPRSQRPVASGASHSS